ncbi:MAG: CpsD/CapB family tyrosine-protein kinase [Verrucomicrobiota bacterium]
MWKIPLAYALAQYGDRVLLVDGDVYHPVQHRILKADRSPGLLNLLNPDQPPGLDEAIQSTPYRNLDFLPAGRTEDAASYSFPLQELESMHAELRERYDMVIIDTPPVIGISTAMQFARFSDGAFLVIQHARFPINVVSMAKKTMDQAGCHIRGLILNQFVPMHDEQYYTMNYDYEKDERKRS